MIALLLVTLPATPLPMQTMERTEITYVFYNKEYTILISGKYYKPNRKIDIILNGRPITVLDLQLLLETHKAYADIVFRKEINEIYILRIEKR